MPSAHRCADPDSRTNKIYQWGTMEGGSTSGYFAIRMKSEYLRARVSGAITQKNIASGPGRFCG